MSSLVDLRKISPATQTHLQAVYSTLSLGGCSTCLGIGMYMLFDFSDVEPMVYIIDLILFLSLWFSSSDKGNSLFRLGLFLAFSFFQGILVTPLIKMSLEVSVLTILIAAIATTAVFLSFTSSAIVNRNRSYLYLTGVLNSILTAMLVLGIVGMFVGETFLFFILDLNLYVGLFLFSFYVFLDTQLIIERSKKGETDFIRHALFLYIDFIGIFFRSLLIIVQISDARSSRVTSIPK